MTVRLKPASEQPARGDGTRVLVDGAWPRGVSKEDADIDLWLKDIAPTPRLRKWFGHDPDKWDEFQRRYFKELDTKHQVIAELLEMARRGRVTLVFGARNGEHNSAAALRDYLLSKRKRASA